MGMGDESLALQRSSPKPVDRFLRNVHIIRGQIYILDRIKDAAQAAKIHKLI